jgi:hypothetical protein
MLTLQLPPSAGAQVSAGVDGGLRRRLKQGIDMMT